MNDILCHECKHSIDRHNSAGCTSATCPCTMSAAEVAWAEPLVDAAKDAKIILMRIGNDEYCDNDGRGCGSVSKANEAEELLTAALADLKRADA